MVGGFYVIPYSLLVSCPRSYVDSVLYIETEPVKLYELEGDKTVTVSLGVIPSSRLSFTETEVEVGVDIQPLGEMVMDNLPVRLVHVPDGLSVVIQPSTYSIRLRGGIDFLATLSRDSIQAVIDYAEEQRLNRLIPNVAIRTPADVNWSQITPSRFNIVQVDEVISP
jgi:YbbR domain-containing protein